MFKKNKMFKKKSCKKCGKKISSSYDFCPHCGKSLNSENQGDWGMLGKSDLIGLDEMKLPLGFNTIFKSLVKNLNKEFSRLDQEMNNGIAPKEKIPKKGISISISTSGNSPPRINVQHFGSSPEKRNVRKHIDLKPKVPSTDKLKKMASLPKEESSIEMKRIEGNLVYEINMPEVQSIEDVSILQLENSIEIKALGKNRTYFKRIPINLPITNYNLEEGKLVLELRG